MTIRRDQTLLTEILVSCLPIKIDRSEAERTFSLQLTIYRAPKRIGESTYTARAAKLIIVAVLIGRY